MSNLQQAKKLPNLMDRETVQDVCEAAEAYRDNVDNEHWKDAFRELAMAADRVDAMLARSEFRPSIDATE